MRRIYEAPNIARSKCTAYATLLVAFAFTGAQERGLARSYYLRRLYMHVDVKNYTAVLSELRNVGKTLPYHCYFV